MNKHCALLATLLGVLLTIGCGPPETLLIAVTVNGVSDDIEFVEVAPTLNGVLQKTEQFRGASRSFFALELPADTKGTFDLAVRGQLPIQCAIAVGAASVNLDQGGLTSFHDGRPYYPVQIDLSRLDGPQCSLSVQKTGTGKGTVYSLPRPGGPVECGQKCSADFPLGAVQLSAVSEPDSYFLGWEGVCSGTETTCTVQLPLQQPIVAHFAPKICTADSGTRWCWDNPLPQGNHLKAVQVSSDGKQVWAAGDHGTLLHLVNGEWLPVRLGTSAGLAGLFVCGREILVGGPSLAGGAPKPLLFSGTVDSTIFDQQQIQGDVPTKTNVESVWCDETGSVAVATGQNLLAWRYKDGSSPVWKADGTLTLDKDGLHAIAGAGNQAWAVGVSGHVIHGTNLDSANPTWTLLSGISSSTETLRSIWVHTTTDIWIVGDGGVVLHFDQNAWKQETLPGLSNAPLNAVWGNGDEVWIAGNVGRTWHRHGGVWTFESAAKQNIRGGSGFTLTQPWVVGDNGLIATRTGNSWHQINRGTTEILYDIVGEGDTAYAGGSATLLRWDGTAWSRLSSDFTGVIRSLWKIEKQLYVGLEDNSIWSIAGIDSNLPIWTALDNPGPSTTSIGTKAFWGLSATDLWAVGPDAKIRHSDGQKWEASSVPGFKETWGIWGTGTDVLVVGLDNSGSGIVLRPPSLKPEHSSTRPLRGIWGNASELWAVGDLATVLKWQQGMGWSSGPTLATNSNLVSVWGSLTGSVFLAGDNGAVSRIDRATPAFGINEETGTDNKINKLWGSRSGLWLVGANGTILRRIP